MSRAEGAQHVRLLPGTPARHALTSPWVVGVVTQPLLGGACAGACPPVPLAILPPPPLMDARAPQDAGQTRGPCAGILAGRV